MKTYNSTPKTFVTFHIGRGGHYYNPGYLSFIEIDAPISSYTDNLFLYDRDKYGRFIEKAYYDVGGNHKGLTEKQANEGTGTIDIDGGYDTTYVLHLDECSEDELQLIYNAAIKHSSGYVSDDVLEYVKECLGIKVENDTEE